MEIPVSNDQLHYDELPAVEMATLKKHPKRFLNKKLIASLVSFVPLLIGVVILFLLVEIMWINYAALSLTIIIFLWSLLVSYKGYFLRGYVLREQDITYRKGWIFQHQITVPFNRIQHTEINHGPIDRLFRLKELDIYTAGGSTSDLRISGLDPDEAERLKEFIANQVAQYA
ncbi:MAG: PH domain-containing protein [Nonlabens sp.]